LIVSDASPLIALARIGQLDLCKLFFDVVVIPVAVHDEIDASPRGFEGARPDWIQVQSVRDAAAAGDLLRDLDRGEAEAIVLAEELQAFLLIDESGGRRFALARGLQITGTLGVLLAAKLAGHIESLTAMLELLEDEGFHMSARLVADVRAAAGEEVV
jgi:hypothetical protein